MGLYNCDKTLEDCINSLLNQTFVNWELVMCNDGSTDQTKHVAEKYVERFNNIFLINNEINNGLAASLNRCLDYSNGEYIARIDADDICFPDRLSKQVQFLDHNREYDMVGSWALLYDENGIKGVRKKEKAPDKFSMKFGSPFIHPSIMMKKVVYKKLGGYTVKTRTTKGQDTDLWFRFFYNGYKAYNLEEPLIKYHESVDDYRKRNLKTAFYRMQNHYQGFKLLNFPKSYYIWLLKPIISSLIPNKVMYWYHKKLAKKAIGM